MQQEKSQAECMGQTVWAETQLQTSWYSAELPVRALQITRSNRLFLIMHAAGFYSEPAVFLCPVSPCMNCYNTDMTAHQKPAYSVQMDFDEEGNLLEVHTLKEEESSAIALHPGRKAKFTAFLLLLSAVCFFLAWLFRKDAGSHLQNEVLFGGIGLFLWASIRILLASGSQGRWMSREEFLEDWIVDRRSQKGYKYQDQPGCYVIASYERPLKSSDQIRNYQNVYVGQSLRVYHRIFSHFSGRGNGEVYSDIRDGLYVYVRVVPCREKKLNEMERRLIQVYHATKSYNKTEGGGTIRR